MQKSALQIAEKKLLEASQQYQLLSLRLARLYKEYNPKAEKTRNYSRNTELIENSENRLKELETEIEKFQRKVIDLKKKRSENMVVTPREEYLPTNPQANTGNPIAFGDNANNIFTPSKHTRSDHEKYSFIEKYNPYPSVFDQDYSSERNLKRGFPPETTRENEFDLRPSGIKTNPKYPPKKTADARNIRFDQNRSYGNDSDQENVPKSAEYFELPKQIGNREQNTNVNIGYTEPAIPNTRENSSRQSGFPNVHTEHKVMNPTRGINSIQPLINNHSGNNPYPISANPIQIYPIQQSTNGEARSTFLRRLRAIPKFNGEKYEDLKDFTDTISTLYSSCTNNTEADELYQHMLLQLRGEAKSVVLSLNNADWEKIKSTLLDHFAYLSNQNILISQLENLHQEKNETLTEFSARARKLLSDRNATYNYLSEEQKKEHNRIARRASAKGVNDPKLKDRLLTRGANSLEVAIAYAIEAESDALATIPGSELFCRVCRITGHREKDCRRQMGGGNVVNSLVSALRTFSIQNRPMAPNLFNRTRAFTGRSPLTPNNRFNGNRFNGNRFNENRYSSNNNQTMRRNDSQNNRASPSPWTWNSNNRPEGPNRPFINNGNGNRNNSQTNSNSSEQQNTRPQFKRQNQGNFNTMTIPQMQNQPYSSSSSGDESEN